MNNIVMNISDKWTISWWISRTNEQYLDNMFAHAMNNIEMDILNKWKDIQCNISMVDILGKCAMSSTTQHSPYCGRQSSFFICTSLFFVFIARFFYFYFHVYHAIFSYDSEGVESPTRLHAFWTLFCFASYHFATLNESFHWDSMYIIGGYTPLMKILRKKLYSINHSWVVALRLCYFSKVSAIRPVNSVRASSACKKTGTTFWMYCLSVPGGWERRRYLGISNKVAMFSAVSLKCSLLLLYAVA